MWVEIARPVVLLLWKLSAALVNDRIDVIDVSKEGGSEAVAYNLRGFRVSAFSRRLKLIEGGLAMRSTNLVPMVLFGMFLAAAPAGAADKYGAGVTLSSATPIVQLLGRPANFSGKTVRVEGVVTEVCTAMGCWMALAPEGQPNGSTVLIQVEHDGVIVFPLTAKGHKAAAQGVMEKIEGGEGREAASELARQQGAKAEAPAAWRIAATGAVVY